MQNPLRNKCLKSITTLGLSLFFLVSGDANALPERVNEWVYSLSSKNQNSYMENQELESSEVADMEEIEEEVDEDLEEPEDGDETEEDDWGFLGDVDEEGLDEECFLCNGYLDLCYGYFKVCGDNGRFREDQWMNDKGRGGIDWFHYECLPEDECDYHVLLEGKAIFDDWYDAHFYAQRSDGRYYLNSGLTSWRHYFDGTTKFANSKEISDSDIYLDRRTYFAEVGYNPICCPEIILGWHRLENDGKSTPLRSVTKDNFNLGPYNRPGLLIEDGKTDTFYGEIAKTFCSKYNVRLRTEYEQYDDNQHGRFNTNKLFKEDDDFRIWRQYVLFDTFLNQCTYLSFNYLFHDVKNTTERDVFEESGEIEYLGRDVENEKYSHIAMGRLNRQKLLGFCHLTFDGRLRAEYSYASFDSDEINESSRRAGFWTVDGSTNQWRFEESAQFTYKGFYRTTLTADTLFEQRYDKKKLFVDHDGEDEIDRKADIDYFKQQYTMTAVHRFNNCLKTTFRARYKRWVRDYDERENNTPGDYPGYLGDYIRNGGEITSKTEYRFNPCLSTFLYYQWREETRKTDLAGRTERSTAHRIANTTSWNPCDRIFLTATGIYENRRSDTPTDPCPTFESRSETLDSEWKQHSQPYDFRGDNFTIELDGTYGFNPDTIFRLGYRHTKALGTQDFASKYSYNQVDFCLDRNICGFGDFTFCYRFIHFNDRRKKHDDYVANGATVCWKHVF